MCVRAVRRCLSFLSTFRSTKPEIRLLSFLPPPSNVPTQPKTPPPLIEKVCPRETRVGRREGGREGDKKYLSEIRLKWEKKGSPTYGTKGRCKQVEGRKGLSLTFFVWASQKFCLWDLFLDFLATTCSFI